jgi:hypothetical protein
MKYIEPSLKKVLRHSRVLIKHAWRASRPLFKRIKRYAKFAHHHIAKRPHEHLAKKLKWYRAWHSWRFHGHVHAGATSLFALFVLSAMIVTYQRVGALPDLFDNWDFSTPAQFQLDTGLEINGSSVRMKAQNYVSDADTAALYHLDESVGVVANDSSSHANNGAVSNASFIAGRLNNALDFNGTTSAVTVPDSASLSLSQQNTLEAWTKFDSAFSAGSADQRQAVVEKGDYQLYYDNETGKVTYELANNAATGWSESGGNDVNGSWDLNGKRAVNATAEIGSNLYVGIGMDVGDAEVWRFDGTNWTLIGGGAASVNSSWSAQTFEGVYAMTTDGTNLYVGLGLTAGDGEVWRWNGTTWTKIGGDGVSSSWAVNTFEYAYALTYFGGNLYAGLGSSAGDAEVWRWDGTTWTKIGGDSLNSGWTTNYELVASLTNDGTTLYAGLGASAGDAEVWSWNGTTWTKIGGDAVNAGWDATFETVRTLRYLGGVLYAGLGDTAADAEVWSWNGTTWTKIGGDGVGGSWSVSYEQVTAFAHDGTNLYAGLGTSDGDGEVWRWDGSAWAKIGGDGVSSSWAAAAGDAVNTLAYFGGVLYAGTMDAAGSGWVYAWNGTSWSITGGNYVNKSWGYYGTSAVQVMQNIGSYMYAGLGNAAGAALVWRFDGTTWTLIGGQGVNGSWAPNTYEQVMSMASYDGQLFVGLGASANDAEVWRFDGTTWTQVGGDSLNNGWTTNFEEVDSLAAYGGYLYAGIGASASDGEVWRWNGTTWAKIGGDSLNSGWAAGFDRVSSLALYNGELVAGLGSTAGEAEVWRWNGTTWAKIGGDTVGSSWDSANFEQVEALLSFNDKLYAGLGNGTDDAELWEYDGTTWTKIGGDDVNSSWTSGTYERVKTLAVYNGDLYAGLGSGAGDGEVWRWNGTTWTKIGGNGLNSGWGSAIEQVESFSAFKGKFYIGTGFTANADGMVWSWGNNAYLQSTTDSFDTAWHHVAASYDGSTMRVYIDGVLNASLAASISLPDSDRPLLIGRGFGGREYGKPRAAFDGQIDEVRISRIARSSFTTKPYATASQRITLASAVRTSGVWHWDQFTPGELPDGGIITYRLSADDGSTWQYWDGSAWAESSGNVQSNDATTLNDNMDTFPVTFEGIKWQAILTSDGNQRVALNSVLLASTSDTTEPATNADTIAALKAAGGSPLAPNGWTNGSSPYFSWDVATDTESGIKGYCLYLGTDNSANPVTTKGLLGTSPVAVGGQCQFVVSTPNIDLATAGYLGSPLTTNSQPYYLSISAIDAAGNVSSAIEQFQFRFDNTAPTNPGFVTAPSGFINTKEVTFTWPTTGGNAPSDTNSGLVGLQYRIGASGTWYGDSHTGTGDVNDILANDGTYTTVPTPDHASLQEGVNTVYFRTWDAAGNVTSTHTTAIVKINTAGSPSEPQNVNASPTTNTSNSFAFDWDAPATFVGDANNITYCYSVNAVPSSTNCTFTSAGVTSLGAGPYATQPGTNVFYVVARDESNNINYASYSSTNFTANTPAPGIPVNVDIVDVSIKSTSNWRLALTWDVPMNTGAGISSYKVYRSTDNANYVFVGSSSSTTYIDASLSQQRYYYRVTACDSTNNCGANSSVVNELPTGKFTTSAALVANPSVAGVTTRKATIEWSTDRASDSKVAIGTESGKYGSSEVGNSTQVSAHKIQLDNLSAGTTYYFVAKWTDEDGNTGTSQEFTLRTAPAPTLKEITTTKVGLSSATVQFTSRDATKVLVQYGQSESFGGATTVNTSISESTYSVDLTNLQDGVKYFYRLISYDSEGTSYEGSVSSFTTPPRPRISDLRFQPIAGEPTSTQEVSWRTNVPSTSLVAYSKLGGKPIEYQVSDMVTDHRLIIRDLEDDSEYTLVAQSRDGDGNVAISDTQSFRTALDTRPPRISDVVIEASIRGTGAEARGQLVVSWKTDEPATSQVAFAEGSSVTSFNNKTSEDTALTTEHIVIVSDLPTSKVYSVKAVSRDRSQNSGESEPESAIIGRASDSVLTVILNTLQRVFGL